MTLADGFGLAEAFNGFVGIVGVVAGVVLTTYAQHLFDQRSADRERSRHLREAYAEFGAAVYEYLAAGEQSTLWGALVRDRKQLSEDMKTLAVKESIDAADIAMKAESRGSIARQRIVLLDQDPQRIDAMESYWKTFVALQHEYIALRDAGTVKRFWELSGKPREALDAWLRNVGRDIGV